MYHRALEHLRRLAALVMALRWTCCVGTGGASTFTPARAPTVLEPGSTSAFRSDCHKGMAHACETLALRLILTGRASDTEEAVPLLRRLCDESSAPACDVLGDYRSHLG